VKVQTKTDQNVQCKGGGLKLIFVDQIWCKVSNYIGSYKDSESNF